MKRTFDIAIWTNNKSERPEKLSVECEQTNDSNVWKGHCPLGIHTDKNPSFYCYLNDLHWHCFGCKKTGPLWDEDKTNNKKVIQATYDYTDEGGELLYQVVRYIPKDFRQRRPDPNNKSQWIWNTKGIRKVLYNLPRILKFPNSIIFLLEGEKACDRFNKFGLVATTCVCGAEKWRDEYNPTFKDRNIVACPDNNDTGRRHCRDVGNRNIGNTKSFKYLELPGLAEKEGADDWLDKIEAVEVDDRKLTKEEIIEELKSYIDFEGEWKEEEVPIDEKFTFSLEELLDADVPDEKLIMGRGIMPIKGYMIIAAGTKAGKTIFSLKLAIHLVLKEYFLEIPIMEEGLKVLYLYAESSGPLLNDTLKKILKGMEKRGIKIDKSFWKNILFHDAIKHKTRFNSKDYDLGRLKGTIDKFQPDVIFIDPIGRMTSSNLNNAEVVVDILNQCFEIKEGFWVFLHHDRKPGVDDEKSLLEPIHKIRGSATLTDFAESTVCIEPAGSLMPNNFKKIYFYLRRWYSPVPIQAKWDYTDLNFDSIDDINFKRKGTVSVSDLITYITNVFGGRGHRRAIVLGAAQEFCKSEVAIYQLIREALEDGLLVKDKNDIVIKGD